MPTPVWSSTRGTSPASYNFATVLELAGAIAAAPSRRRFRTLSIFHRLAAVACAVCSRGRRSKFRAKPKRRDERSLDELPDEILIGIISLLGTRDAVRTSVLSRSWRDLWKHIQELVVYTPDIIIPEENWKCYSGKVLTGGDAQRLSRCTHSILQSRCSSGAPLESLTLHLFLDGRHEAFFDTWISLALSSKVKNLVFIPSFASDRVMYRFPFHLFSLHHERGGGLFMESLTIKCCFLKPSAMQNLNLDGFKTLTKLSLEDVRVADDAIHRLLPECAALKRLSLVRCFRLRHLEIPSSSKLESLHVEHCGGLVDVQCGHARSLSVIRYAGSKLDVMKAAHFVEEAHITGDHHLLHYVYTQLPHDMPSLKTLRLDMDGYHLLVSMPSHQARLLHLKRLEIVDYKSYWRIDPPCHVIMASHILEELRLEFTEIKHFYSDTMINKIRPEDNHPHHHHLKRVEISPFTGRQHQLVLLRFLISIADRLEVIIMDNSHLHCSRRVEVALQSFNMHLRHQVPEHVKIVFK